MLTDEFAQYLQNPPPGIIAIDGELGAGKSSTADALARRYRLPVIHVDDYLTPEKHDYIAALKIDDLKDAVERKGLPLIIEGVCILDVLTGINSTAALHFFLHRSEFAPYKPGSRVVQEVEQYISRTNAPHLATRSIVMNGSPTNQLDVDITYLKAKTVVSVALAMGGVAALLVGAYVLTSGINSNDSAAFEILGAKVTAEGIGAVILASSVFWAYFAYSARPIYARRKEVRNTTAADGSQSRYEFESSTMVAAEPYKEHP